VGAVQVEVAELRPAEQPAAGNGERGEQHRGDEHRRAQREARRPTHYWGDGPIVVTTVSVGVGAVIGGATIVGVTVVVGGETVVVWIGMVTRWVVVSGGTTEVVVSAVGAGVDRVAVVAVVVELVDVA